MKSKLTMDDLREGMFVTILKGAIHKEFHRIESSEELFKIEDKGLKGKVLKVLEVNFPYALVIYYDVDDYTKKYTLDMREITFMRLSNNYVKAYNLKIDIDEKKDVFWDEVEETLLEQIDETLNKIKKDLEKE